ncbi:unnamed protein product [Spodoptera littoralis]|uniref:Peptidase S1 domain-containing protein n=1 Tax=Spodoptera littoralis TaxID=7109 RepID=A0A9P0I6X7_SPOLI|nr:unnamed protein product [Spodoptera littoralis]CAH1641078.1 unnamed protein product [Spodoptera littoralis]
MIAALCTFLALVAVSFEQDTRDSTPISPCPNVFMYEPPGSEQGRWYGVVNLSTDSTLHSLWLNIVLDNKADILGNWIGDVSTQDNKDFKIENADMQINPGPAVAVRFFVQFNPLNKTPRLQAIRLNGREICNANTPQPVINDRPDVIESRPSQRPTNGIELNTKPVQTPPRESPRPVYPRPGSQPSPSNIPSSSSNQDLDRPNYVLTTQRPDRTRRPVRKKCESVSCFFSSSPPRDTEYWDGPAVIVLPAPDKTNTKTHGGQAQCGKVVLNPIPLVVNGTPTLEGQWPWQIALYQTQVGNIIVHPDYNATTFSRDAAILELRETVTYSDWVRPACLWPDSDTSLKNVIGKKGSLSLVEMPVVSQETCIRSYSEFFVRFTSEYTYCAGYRDGHFNEQTGVRESTSVCNGDSGGGMVFRMGGTWYLRGLVSLSVARQNEYRCDPSHYVIFTDLAKFLPWIYQNVYDF